MASAWLCIFPKFKNLFYLYIFFFLLDKVPTKIHKPCRIRLLFSCIVRLFLLIKCVSVCLHSRVCVNVHMRKAALLSIPCQT